MNLIHSLAVKAAWAATLLSLPAPLPVRANPGPATSGPVAGTMAVSVTGEEIRVTLTFVNHTSRIAWLEKHEEGQAPMRAEFEIRSEDGRLVPYLGPTAKRPAYAKEDFFPLEPGRSWQREVRIDDLYDFPEGRKDYRVTCSFPTWNPRTRQAVFHTLKSVRFTCSR